MTAFPLSLVIGADFVHKIETRPSLIALFEATSAFILITTWPFALRPFFLTTLSSRLA